MSPKTISLEEQRARLESKANVIRSRLFRTMDALDNRRHQVTEVAHQAKRLAVPLAAGVVGFAVLAAGVTLAVGAALERRRSRDVGYRVSRALAPLRYQPRPFWSEALRKMVFAGLGVAATQLVKRGFEVLEHARATPSPPLALGPAVPLLRSNGERPLLGE